MEPDQWLAGGDRVAVLDEPLDHLAAVVGVDGEAVTRLLATSPIGAPAARTEESAASGEMWKMPLEGATTIRHVGEFSISENSPCLSQNARASSSWSGVLSANVSTPFMARFAMPVRVPAGGISRKPVTPRSSIVSMQRSQRTGLAIWPTIRLSTSTPLCTTRPSRLEITLVRGSWTETDLASEREVAHGRSHVLGVERAGDAQRHQPRLLRRLLGERRELLHRPGGDDLAGAVVVGGGQAVLVDGGEHLVAVAAEHRGHARRRRRGRTGHRLAALADEDHRLLGGDDAGAGGGGELADAVAGDRADLAERVGRVREDPERRDEPGGDQQRLRDLGLRGWCRRPRRCRSG